MLHAVPYPHLHPTDVHSQVAPGYSAGSVPPATTQSLKYPHGYTGYLAVPHRLTADDVYNGYHLPNGSIVVGNAW